LISKRRDERGFEGFAGGHCCVNDDARMRFLNRPLLAGLVLAGCVVILYLWLGTSAPL
jgi:hypothetical protein